jgi:tRNA(fMet)-specific endonuclease VapC
MDAPDRTRHQHVRGFQAGRDYLCGDDWSGADTYGLLYRGLRQQGTPIPSNDLWIAASCLKHGAVLFRLDGHFERVPGLRVVRRWSEMLP